MQLKEQIEKDLSQALRDRDEMIVSVLRMLKAGWQNLGIELRADGKELTEEDILKTLKKEVKKRKESIDMFIKGAREDLVNKEKKELEILKQYLPEELSEEALRETLKKVIDNVEEEFKDNFGILMKKAAEELKEQFEGSRVSKILKDLM